MTVKLQNFPYTCIVWKTIIAGLPKKIIYTIKQYIVCLLAYTEDLLNGSNCLLRYCPVIKALC